MNKHEIREADMNRRRAAAATLTQDQIDACAWVMGCATGGWTKEEILATLPPATINVVIE